MISSQRTRPIPPCRGNSETDVIIKPVPQTDATAQTSAQGQLVRLSREIVEQSRLLPTDRLTEDEEVMEEQTPYLKRTKTFQDILQKHEFEGIKSVIISKEHSDRILSLVEGEVPEKREFTDEGDDGLGLMKRTCYLQSVFKARRNGADCWYVRLYSETE